jgi:hypothetical protein
LKSPGRLGAEPDPLSERFEVANAATAQDRAFGGGAARFRTRYQLLGFANC